MDIKRIMKKYKSEMSPTKEQNERVFLKVFGELPKTQSNFVNFIQMFNSKQYQAFLGVFVVFILFAAPIIYSAANSSDSEVGLNKTTTTSQAPLSDSEDGTADTFLNSSRNYASTGAGAAEIAPDSSYYVQPKQGEEDLTTAQSDRAVEKSGYFTAETKDIKTVFEAVKNFATEFDGYIVSSSFSGGKSKYGSVTLRLPADKFDLAVNKLREFNLEIVSESISTVDRQNQITELEKSQKTLEEEQKALEDQLKTETDFAKKKELQAQIDSIKSSIAYYKESLKDVKTSTEFSTMVVSLQEKDSSGLDFSNLGKDWSDIPEVAKYYAVFWAQIAVFGSIPLVLILVIYFVGRRYKSRKQ